MRNLKFISLFYLTIFLLSCNNKKELPNSVKTIIEDHSVPKIKKSLNVILRERINESELEILANQIYENYDGNSYKNFFIVYYQNGMTIDNGGYATTNFTPNLDLKIYGITKDEYKTIVENNFTEKRFWFDDGWKVVVSINKENGNFKLKRYFTNSEVEIKKIRLNIKNSDTIFIIPNSTGGEFYKINENDELEQYDNKGLVYKMIKK